MYDELIRNLRNEANEAPALSSVGYFLMRQAADAIEDLSKERKTGVWLMDKMTRTCSVCGQMKATSHKDNFCPNCGADMRGEDDGT